MKLDDEKKTEGAEIADTSMRAEQAERTGQSKHDEQVAQTDTADHAEKTRQLELVIFDMDGLLIDSEQVAARAQLQAARMLELDFTLEDYKKLIGVNYRKGVEILSELWETPTVKRFLDTSETIENDIVETEGIPLKDGVFELLDFLDEYDIPRVVATSTARPRAEERLSNVGILPRINGLVCGNEVEHAKPHPEIFLRSLGETKGDNAVIFEDSHNGLRAGIAAGIPVLYVPDMLPPPQDLTPEAVLASLFEAIPYLKQREGLS